MRPPAGSVLADKGRMSVRGHHETEARQRAIPMNDPIPRRLRLYWPFNECGGQLNTHDVPPGKHGVSKLEIYPSVRECAIENEKLSYFSSLLAYRKMKVRQRMPKGIEFTSFVMMGSGVRIPLAAPTNRLKSN